METQSAFMAAAAASVILVAILVHRRDRTAILFAALTLAFGLYSFGHGAQGLGYFWAAPVAGVGLYLDCSR